MAGEGRRVLIADADAALRQRLYGALLEADLFSDCVSSGADARAKLREEQYGVVVLDVGLPTEIEEVIGALAAMPQAQRPVVLVLASNPEAARSLDVDIVQIVLRRPVVLSQLVDLVRSCMRSAEGRDASSQRRADDDGDYVVS